MNLLTILGLRKHPIELSEDAEVDEKVTVENLYKHRWVWYHLILCSQMIITNILLVAILLITALK
jgi:hypothetical protein|tara:strand:+ start:249 stop:443 length:195 start_codon:yes stop_codon:yes gene_type:complete